MITNKVNDFLILGTGNDPKDVKHSKIRTRIYNSVLVFVEDNTCGLSYDEVAEEVYEMLVYSDYNTLKDIKGMGQGSIDIIKHARTEYYRRSAKEKKRITFRNGSGYLDPTAYLALEKPSKDESTRFFNLLHTIKCVCNCAGFELSDRISVTDKRTGREWH